MSKDKQARRASDAQKIALEKQLVKEGKIFPRTRYVPRSFAGRVLAVVLAFLIGVVAAIGGLLGVGYFAGTRPPEGRVRNAQHRLHPVADGQRRGTQRPAACPADLGRRDRQHGRHRSVYALRRHADHNAQRTALRDRRIDRRRRTQSDELFRSWKLLFGRRQKYGTGQGAGCDRGIRSHSHCDLLWFRRYQRRGRRLHAE